MNRTIPLWSGPAPLFEEAAGQSAPSLTMFPAKNARGGVLVVPGGGYDHKAAHEGAPIAERLNAIAAQQATEADPDDDEPVTQNEN